MKLLLILIMINILLLKIYNKQQVLIYQILLKKTDLTNLISDVDKLSIKKLKNVPSILNNLKVK